MFTPVRTRRTFEEAAEQIADKVRIGQLRVGDKLPGERALATQMQISRPTVREAVRVLADAGVLSVRPGPNGGTSVASGYVPLELLQGLRFAQPSVLRGEFQKCGQQRHRRGIVRDPRQPAPAEAHAQRERIGRIVAPHRFRARPR